MKASRIFLTLLIYFAAMIYYTNSVAKDDQIGKDGFSQKVQGLNVDAQKAIKQKLAQAYEMPASTAEEQRKRVESIRQSYREIFKYDKVDQTGINAERRKVLDEKSSFLKKERELEQQKKQVISTNSGKKSSSKVTRVEATLEPDGFEPDNSHNQGEKLVDGFHTTKHNIYPVGDIDFFYFEGNAGDIIEIITKTPNPFWSSDQDPYQLFPPSEADLDPYITLYLPDRTVLADDDDSGQGWDSYINIQLPVSGTYFISMESSPLRAPNLTTGDYEIGIEFVKADPFEPDNSMATASVINDGQTLTGHTILPIGDEDFYQVTISTPGTALHGLIVNSPNAGNGIDAAELYKGDLDPCVDVFDQSGNLLYTMDDTNNPLNPQLGFYDVELMYSFLTPGVYYIKVYASPKATGFNTQVGSYTISLDLVLPDPFEPDNMPANANPIAYGETIDGHTITSIIDGDMYKFQGEAGDFVDIYVKSNDDPCGDLDPGVALFGDGSVGNGSWGSTLDWLHSSMDDGIGLDAHIVWGPLPYSGTYYLEVGADPLSWYNWWERAGEYSISLDKVTYAVYWPFKKNNAIPIANCQTLSSTIPRQGVVWPDDEDVSTYPVFFTFEGTAGESITAKVTTPFQYRGVCGTFQSDWMDDLNPQLTLLDLNGDKLVFNDNIDPNNDWDDAQIVYTLSYSGTYFLKVNTEIVKEGPLFEFFDKSDSYGDFTITLMKAPEITDFDSDRNVGPAPLSVNFFGHCLTNEEPCVDTFLWDFIYGYHGSAGASGSGQETAYCYWTLGSHDVKKMAGNLAGFATKIKEDFIQIYGPSGYAPMVFVNGSEAHSTEPWENAIDGDTYCWNGVATVEGSPAWATFAFVDGRTKSLNKIRLLTDGGVGMEERWIKKFSLEVSLDGATFTPVLSEQLLNGGWHDFVISPSVQAKFIKLSIEEPVSGWRQITELEAYEDIVLPDMDKSSLAATSPHLANGSDASLLTLTLIDKDGNPITTYDSRDISFHVASCKNGNFGPLDLSEASQGIYKCTLTSNESGSVEVAAAAHGAIFNYDKSAGYVAPAVVEFFGSSGQKGSLVFVQGSPTAKGEGWDNAIDGDREGWDGTTTAKGEPCYAIFKFENGMRMPFNKIGLATDNGFDDDDWEERLATDIEILKSDDMTNWSSVARIRRSTGEYRRYKLSSTQFAKYVMIVLHQPDWTNGGWRQISELEILFDSKAGFAKGDPTEEIIGAQSAPTDYAIAQNYPNPFNPTTNISFQLPEATHVTLKVYNTLGQEVATLIDAIVEAGYHSATWNATDVPSGIYIYRITMGSFSKSARMILLK